MPLLLGLIMPTICDNKQVAFYLQHSFMFNVTMNCSVTSRFAISFDESMYGFVLKHTKSRYTCKWMASLHVNCAQSHNDINSINMI